ncbi:MAG: D-alanyl-D-alanine carboxypeptidase family protein [Bacilli bacterium]
MKKIFFLLLLIPTLTKALPLDLAKTSKSAIMIEASTGNVIFEKNPNEKLHPASMTKIMTMLLVMEAIDDSVIRWDEMVTVSANASGMGGSQILLETNEKMTVEDLFKGVAIASGNDAAVALAEKIAGSEDVFVGMMNKKAKELGLENTNFKNPHGLDATNHYSTAKDMSILAKELIKHEKVLKYTSIYETYLRENLDTKIWLVNTNKLVRFYKGVDGLKTGFTEGAGYCLTTTAKKNEMRLITVVMGSETATVRNAETTEMLDYGFAQYELNTILTKKTNLGKIKVLNGKTKYSKVVPKEDITFLKKKSDKEVKTNYKLKLDKVKSPIKVGDKIGKVLVYKDLKKVREVELTVKENNDKVNIIIAYFRNLKDTIIGE